MKTILSVLFTSLLTIGAYAQSESYRTLSKVRDSITIPAGQTAFIVSSTSQVRLGVAHDCKREVQYSFEDSSVKSQFQITQRTYRNRLTLPQPSLQSPVPIAGPAVLTLRTSGIVTVSFPEKRRHASTSSNSNPVRRLAKL